MDDRIVYDIKSLVLQQVRPIIEVGCGKGNISRIINPDLCIEIDNKFIKYLKNYNLILADARFLPIFRGQIISSLPFYITYDFMLEVSSLSKISYLVLILQKDFVYKILKKPTFISYLLNYYYKINLIK
ncbi:MAG: 16S rRNA (adenine(1518)-N(6)/adenine(1519)-N(6))-dimethyltransferase, partial [Sulfolobales archaeon]